MRKKIGFLLVVMVFMMLCVSCKNAQEPSKNQNGKPNSAENQETYNLRILTMTTANKSNTYDDIVNTFLAEYPYYTVDLEVVQSEAAAYDAVDKNEYDILFLESVDSAERLFGSEKISDMTKFIKEYGIQQKISNVFASKWEYPYAVPFFLKMDCEFSGKDGVRTEPIDYVARVIDKESESLNSLICTGFPTEQNGIVQVDCTCVCMGSIKDKTNAELFLATLFEEESLSSCVRTSGIPLACRVTLSDVNLYGVTESIYKQLADSKIILQYKTK